MRSGDVLVARQRVAHQDDVGALGVDLTVGLEGDIEGAYLDPTVEPKRRIAPELDHLPVTPQRLDVGDGIQEFGHRCARGGGGGEA